MAVRGENELREAARRLQEVATRTSEALRSEGLQADAAICAAIAAEARGASPTTNPTAVLRTGRAARAVAGIMEQTDVPGADELRAAVSQYLRSFDLFLEDTQPIPLG